MSRVEINRFIGLKVLPINDPNMSFDSGKIYIDKNIVLFYSIPEGKDILPIFLSDPN